MNADFYSYREATKGEDYTPEVRKEVGRLKKEGANSVRLTTVNDQHVPSDDFTGFWLEGWKDVIDTSGLPFEPPLTDKRN